MKLWFSSSNEILITLQIPRVVEKEIVYNLVNNKCVQKEINSKEKTSSDYSLGECENKIIDEEVEEEDSDSTSQEEDNTDENISSGTPEKPDNLVEWLSYYFNKFLGWFKK
jgi:hypothetical protein